MRFDIAAVAHFDPLCRSRLLQWLRQSRENYPTDPALIAIEWDPEQFELVRSQRARVHNIAVQRWPKASSRFLDALSSCVAFEGDTHLEVFPEVPIIWLDRGRVVSDPTVISNYAVERVNVYASYFEEEDSGLDGLTLLDMSTEAWNRLGERWPGGTSRDVKFAWNLFEASRQYPGEWAIVIVGANHASDDPGYMKSLLEEKGSICIVTVLSPEFDSA